MVLSDRDHLLSYQEMLEEIVENEDLPVTKIENSH